MAAGAGDSVWSRPEPARRPRLTRAAIVAAAVALADAEGLAAVSIRRVAAELGVRTMSLYTYIDRKEDLLDLMADEVAGEVLIDAADLPTDWRAAITAVVAREREVARRHPWMVDLLSRLPRIGPNGLRHTEQTLTALSALGLDARATFRLGAAIDQYVLGNMVADAVLTSADSDLGRARLAQLVEIATGGDFPRLSAIFTGDPPDTNTYQLGLDLMLDGIEARYGPGRRDQARPPA
jgi:AcrR family transcriptional regulator